MIVFNLRIQYRDGTQETVAADQYAVSVWERWAWKAGLKSDPSDPGPLMMTQYRVMAWATVQRDAKTKTAFEVWDATVAEAGSADDAEPVDPTGPAT